MGTGSHVRRLTLQLGFIIGGLARQTAPLASSPLRTVFYLIHLGFRTPANLQKSGTKRHYGLPLLQKPSPPPAARSSAA
jgi:hypothetical protein